MVAGQFPSAVDGVYPYPAELEGTGLAIDTLKRLVGTVGLWIGFAAAVLPGCAAYRQDEAARELGVPKRLVLDLGEEVSLEAMLIPAGTFMMGAEETRKVPPYPRRRITLTKAFYMGKFEVTNAQYLRFLAASGYDWRKDPEFAKRTDMTLANGPLMQFHPANRSGFAQCLGDRRPIVYLHFEAMRAFCRWATKRTGYVVRLPTDAEWEYACRAGTTGKYYFPRLMRPAYEWTRSDVRSMVDLVYAWQLWGPTHDVGKKLPNPWGLHDMLGNVSEVCSDEYSHLTSEPQVDPVGPPPGAKRIVNEPFLPPGALRVLRGGSVCGLDPCFLRYSFRRWYYEYNIGFRVCIEVKRAVDSADVAENAAVRH